MIHGLAAAIVIALCVAATALILVTLVSHWIEPAWQSFFARPHHLPFLTLTWTTTAAFPSTRSVSHARPARQRQRLGARP